MAMNAETTEGLSASVKPTMANRIACDPDQYGDGIAFRFVFPADGLALRAVDIVNGVPKLRFVASPNVPTINEEDVAVCVRLRLDDKYPEFFYSGFPIGHPFYDAGRFYKLYQPTYLRDTSVGELLAEVDWLMKCLHVGVRSDKSKTKFWSWKDTSQLEGLATREDFFEDLPNATIVMSCKSVEVQKGDQELVFVSEPKMRIDAVDRKSNSTYSKYITEIFDSVAYYDEPLFLKMKEIIKLILVIDWFIEKGVKFSQQWVMEHTKKARQTIPQAIRIRGPKMSDDVIQYVINQLQRKFYSNQLQALIPFSAPFITWPDPASIQTVMEEKIFLETGLQLKFKTELSCSSNLTGDLVKVVVTTVMRASLDDYDMVYKGCDPNFPIDFNFRSGEFITTNVRSWSELYSETVPIPCSWQIPPRGTGVSACITGGVTTREIPVKEIPVTAPVSSKCKTPSQQPVIQKSKEQKREKVSNPVARYIRCGEEIAVTASSIRQCKKPNSSIIPKPKTVRRPSSNVRVNTRESEWNRAAVRGGVRTLVGWNDRANSTMSRRDGTPVEQRHSVRVSGEHELTINGQRMAKCKTFSEIPLRPALTQTSENERKPQEGRRNLPLPSLTSAHEPIVAKGSPTTSECSETTSLDGQGDIQPKPMDLATQPPRDEMTSNHDAVDQPVEVMDGNTDDHSSVTDSGISTPQNELESSSNLSEMISNHDVDQPVEVIGRNTDDHFSVTDSGISTPQNELESSSSSSEMISNHDVVDQPVEVADRNTDDDFSVTDSGIFTPQNELESSSNSSDETDTEMELD